MTYGEQLAQRKQEAADEETAFIAHFGPEAEDCTNWDDLWQNGWREVLVNPSPTETYKPKGLPPGWVGGWVSEDGREAGADPPSLYSDKFVFYFAQQLADDKAELLARTTNFLAHADEIDCDQWTTVIDIITTYLSSSILFHITGRGHKLEFNQMDATQQEAFFQKRNSKQNSAGLFITSLGVSITNHQVVPAEVAKGKIQAVRRQIEFRQQQLQAGVFTRTSKGREGKISLPTLALILIYEGQTLQRGEQADLLARDAGHNSGESLYQDYCRFLSYHNRTGFDNETATKGRNMIKRIRAAIPHLSEAARQKAENEIALIEAKIL